MTPALSFETLTGIKDVGRTYVMPGGLPAEKIEDIISIFTRDFPEGSLESNLSLRWKMAQIGVSDIFDSQQTIYQKLSQKLCDLNPELKQVSFNPQDVGACCDFCRGVTSGFNPSDIQYFLSLDRSTPEAQKKNFQTMLDGYIGNLKNRLDGLSGMPGTLAFIPSPSTAAHIHSELDKRYGPDPVASMPEDEKKKFLESVNRLKYENPPQTLWQRTLSMLR